MKTKVFFIMLLTISMSAFAVGNGRTNDCMISGKVTDTEGNPIAGAVLVEQSTKNGVVTDLEGGYKITVPGKTIIECVYVGYQSHFVRVGDKSTQTINITLKKDDTKNNSKSQNWNDKLVFVDGELYNGQLDKISPQSIKEMTVVKNQKDLTTYIERYGDKARNGVILITLKK